MSEKRSVDSIDCPVPGLKHQGGLPFFLKVCSGALVLLVFSHSVRAAGYASVSLNVTVVDDAQATVQPQLASVVCHRSYMKTGVSAQVFGVDQIDQVKLFYRPQGLGPYTEATGGLAFFPNPAGLTMYSGKAIIPGSAYLGGAVEYYFEVSVLGGGIIQTSTISTVFKSQFIAAMTPTGGTIPLPDGDVTDGNTSLAFPPGAMPQLSDVMIESLDPADTSRVPPGNGLANAPQPVVAYDLDANLRQFGKPVAVTMLYPDIDGTPGKVDGTNFDETGLRLFWWDGRTWRLLGGVVDPVKNTVTGQTTHFSVFALFPVGSLSPQSFRPLERIVTPNGDGINDIAFFAGLSGAFEIRIYDSSARRVRTIRDMPPQWDGKDDDGKALENGSYLYQYRTDTSNEWVSGSIGVAR